jgi:tRNA_anti-like
MTARALVILAACLLVSADAPQQTVIVQEKADARKATAAEVIEAYQTNDARADELYTAQQVDVTGEIVNRIESTGDLKTRQYEVIMKGPDSSMQARFQFDVKDRKQLIDLKPDRQVVTIRAYCNGRTDRCLDGGQMTHVRFTRCKILAVRTKVEPPAPAN